jgi:hypothetical protein
MDTIGRRSPLICAPLHLARNNHAAISHIAIGQKDTCFRHAK